MTSTGTVSDCIDRIAIDGPGQQTEAYGGWHVHVKGHHTFKFVLGGLFFEDGSQEQAHRADVFLQVLGTQAWHTVREGAAKHVRRLLDTQKHRSTDVIDAADRVLPVFCKVVVDDETAI